MDLGSTLTDTSACFIKGDEQLKGLALINECLLEMSKILKMFACEERKQRFVALRFETRDVTSAVTCNSRKNGSSCMTCTEGSGMERM